MAENLNVTEAITTIIRMRQTAHREVNAFPAGTVLTLEERTARIRELVPVGEPDAIRLRLGQFVMLGFNSLDLIRGEVNGTWPEGDAIDAEIEEFLARLEHDDAIQEELGVTFIGHYDRNDPNTKPQAMPSRLVEGLPNPGYEVLHVVRKRLVARLAIRESGDIIEVKKRSDFLQAPMPETPEMVAMVASMLAGGGISSLAKAFGSGITLQEALRQQAAYNAQYNDDIHAAIAERAPWLTPVNLNYYVAHEDDSSYTGTQE